MKFFNVDNTVMKSFVIRIFCIAAILPAYSFSQDELDPRYENPEENMELVDRWGVDILSGRHLPDGMSVTIGGKGSGLASTSKGKRIGRDSLSASLILWSIDQSGFPPNKSLMPGFIRSMSLPDGAYYQVEGLGNSDIFHVAAPGAYTPSVNGNFVNVSKKGGSLICSQALCTYTSKQGDIIKFDRNIRTYEIQLSGHAERTIAASATRVEKADGEILTYTYQTKAGYASFGYLNKLPSAVVSSLGWAMKYSFNSYDREVGSRRESESRSICALNLSREYFQLSNVNCEGLSSSFNWPVATLSRVAIVGYSGDFQNFAYSSTTRVKNPGGLADIHNISHGNLPYTDQKETYQTPLGVMKEFEIGDYNYMYHTGVTPSSDTNKILSVKFGGVFFNYTHEDNNLGPIDDDNNDGIPENFMWGPEGTYEVDDYGRLIAFTNKNGARKRYQYHSVYVNKLSRVDNPYPANGYETFHYDDRENLISHKVFPKGGGQPLVTSYSYPTCSPSSQKYCNKPGSVTTPDGGTTIYTYHAEHGGIHTITKPGVMLGQAMVAPVIVYEYAQFTPYAKFNSVSPTPAERPIWRLTKTSECRVAATCLGSVNEAVKSFYYDVSENLLLRTETVGTGDGSASLTTTYEYDEFGNVIRRTGSHVKDVTDFFYDARQRNIGTIHPDKNGSGRLGEYRSYNRDGAIVDDTRGVPNDLTLAGLRSMPIKSGKVSSYFGNTGLLSSEKNFGVDDTTVQYSYDSRFRVLCSAIRLSYQLIDEVCAVNTGNYGPDRVKKFEYNSLDLVTKVVGAYGTPKSQVVAQYLYDSVGRLSETKDGKGNKTSYLYDNFGRLSETVFPHPTLLGTTNSSDSTKMTYVGMRLTSIKLRNNQVINFAYDSWGRVIGKSGAVTESSSHDLFGNITSHTNHTSGVASTYTSNDYYNGLGWLKSVESALGKISYRYDAFGRRVEMKWPDNYYITYDYSGDLSLQSIKDGNSSAALANFEYDALGRLTRLGRLNGSTSYYNYEEKSGLSNVIHDMDGISTSNDHRSTFSYNPVGQIDSSVVTLENPAYKYIATSGQQLTMVDGLNQVTQTLGLTVNHDLLGNISAIGSTTYQYNNNNMMTRAGNVDLRYDAKNRLYKVGSTCFLYDEQNLIAETNCNGTVLNRYIHGPSNAGVVAWYVGNSTNNRRFFSNDRQHSPINISGADGNTVGVNAYDEYGQPMPGNLGRLQFNGQIWIHEIGLYHFNTRIYNPYLGRFMQTDPLGYTDGINWYEYGRNDPVNNTDPTGMLARGSNWSDDDWAKMDAAQKAAAIKLKEGTDALRDAAGKMKAGEAVDLPDHLKGASAEELVKLAQMMDFAVVVLKDNGTLGYRVDQGDTNGSAAMVTGHRSFIVNASTYDFDTRTEWVAGHEALHLAGAEDVVRLNYRAYRDGGYGERRAYDTIPLQDRLKNVDHVLNIVYPE